MARRTLTALLAASAVWYAWAAGQVNRFGDRRGDAFGGPVPFLLLLFAVGAAVSCVLVGIRYRRGLVSAVVGGALTVVCMTAIGAWAWVDAGLSWYSGTDWSDFRADFAADAPIVLAAIVLALLAAVLAGWLRHRDTTAQPGPRPVRPGMPSG